MLIGVSSEHSSNDASIVMEVVWSEESKCAACKTQHGGHTVRACEQRIKMKHRTVTPNSNRKINEGSMGVRFKWDAFERG